MISHRCTKSALYCGAIAMAVSQSDTAQSWRNGNIHLLYDRTHSHVSKWDQRPEYSSQIKMAATMRRSTSTVRVHEWRDAIGRRHECTIAQHRSDRRIDKRRATKNRQGQTEEERWAAISCNEGAGWVQWVMQWCVRPISWEILCKVGIQAMRRMPRWSEMNGWSTMRQAYCRRESWAWRDGRHTRGTRASPIATKALTHKEKKEENSTLQLWTSYVNNLQSCMKQIILWAHCRHRTVTVVCMFISLVHFRTAMQWPTLLRTSLTLLYSLCHQKGGSFTPRSRMSPWSVRKRRGPQAPKIQASNVKMWNTVQNKRRNPQTIRASGIKTKKKKNTQ